MQADAFYYDTFYDEELEGNGVYENIHGNVTLMDYLDSGDTTGLVLFLQNSANHRALDDEIIWTAEQKALVNSVRFLFDHNVDQHVRDDALREAIMYGDTVLVRLLLDHGADVHTRDDEALRKATTRGNISLVRLLLEHGANIHARKETPLSNAIFVEDVKCVTLLLNYGADPTVLSEERRHELSLLIGDGEDDTKPAEST